MQSDLLAGKSIVISLSLPTTAKFVIPAGKPSQGCQGHLKDLAEPGKFHESYVVCTQDKKQIGQAGLV